MSNENQNAMLYQLFEKVGRVDGTVSSLEKKIDAFLESFSKYQEETDKRVSSLENDRAKVIGGAVVAGGIVSFVVSHFKDWLHR